MIAIAVSELSKSYGAKTVLRGLSFEVQVGEVLAVLGPNGAGKTTTFRIICGLSRPSRGKVVISGHEVGAHNVVALREIGALIEGAGHYRHLSPRDNLKILSLTAGLTPSRSRISELLETVGLLDHADRRMHGFSTGMIQRFGVAAALLGGAPLVILDEPTSGLDPAGIRSMRTIIRNLHEQGTTLIISSHQLNDVEDLADRVLLLADGQLRFDGTLEDVKRRDRSIRIRVDDTDLAIKALTGRGAVQDVGSGQLDIRGIELAQVLSVLSDNQVYPSDVATHHASLEDLFFDITEGRG